MGSCREILTKRGYRIIVEHSIGESASADGLLIVPNPELPELAATEISRVEGLVQAHS